MKKSSTPLVKGEPVATVMVPCEQSQRFLSRKQLCEKLSITFPYIWRLIRRGEFPEGRKIGSKPVWLESEVNDWMLRRPTLKYKASDNHAEVAS